MDAKMDYFFEDIKPTQHIDPAVYRYDWGVDDVLMMDEDHVE